jgi:hypothetical protein
VLLALRARVVDAWVMVNETGWAKLGKKLWSP